MLLLHIFYEQIPVANGYLHKTKNQHLGWYVLVNSATKLLSLSTCFDRNFCHLQLITVQSIES